METNRHQYHLLKDEDSNTTTTTTFKNDSNITLVWVDEEALDSMSANYRATIDMFETICGDNYKLYNCKNSFLEDIGTMTKTMELIVIMSGTFAKDMLSDLPVSLLRELSSIIIFCKDYNSYKHLLKKCRKVTDICTDELSLKEAIENELDPPTDFFAINRSLKYIFSLKEEYNGFVWYKKLIEILNYYPWSNDNRENMLAKCREHYRKNNVQKEMIKQFQNEYTPEKAIEWYTRGCFLYQMVNKALRSLHFDEIIIFQPYIKHLCKQIEHLHKENQSNQLITVYRGHGNMTRHQLDEIKENIGALISFNGFLSTSTEYNVAVMFAGCRSTHEESVIYEITTSDSLKNVVFAGISHLSKIQDEDEVLFGLCSVFRIDNVQHDEENQLWRIIMSATDEDALNIPDPINSQPVQQRKSYLLYCINRYCGRRHIITAFAIIFFIIIIALGVILGTNNKSKGQTSSLYNCVGLNCTTYSTITDHRSTLKTETFATKRTESSTSTTLIRNNLTTPAYIKSNESETISLPYCFPVKWSSIGDVLAQDERYSVLTIDDDFNVYAINSFRFSLDKWSPNDNTVTRFLDGIFLTNGPLFFHSLSQSLYFFYIWKEQEGIYKLINGHSKPVNVLNYSMLELGENLRLTGCQGLHVNSLGDIFLLIAATQKVFKWTVNSTIPIVVADGTKFDSIDDLIANPVLLAVDELHDIIYLFSTNRRILKYTNGSIIGTTIIDGAPGEIFSTEHPPFTNLISLIVDVTGCILLGDNTQITIWTPDGKFNAVILKEYQTSENQEQVINQVSSMTFDRLGNLYIVNSMSNGFIKFNRIATTCASNIS